jgi:hypothetical protein
MNTTHRFNLLAGALLVMLGGCAARPINPPITQTDPTTGYSFETRQGNFPGRGWGGKRQGRGGVPKANQLLTPA